MGISSQKRKDFIVNAKNYLENAGTDSFINEQILTIGYDENRLNEGRAMQKKAWETREKQIMLLNKAKSLHTRLREEFVLRLKSFTGDVRLFRSTFIRDIPVKEKLQLYGERKRSIPGYLEQARAFYSTLLKEKDILNQLAAFNITAETVQAKLTEIDDIEKKYAAYKDADQDAQNATDECGKEFRKLRDWIRIFQDACRIVLKEKPQLQEKVGILVRSSRLRRKSKSEAGDGNQSLEQT